MLATVQSSALWTRVLGSSHLRPLDWLGDAGAAPDVAAIVVPSASHVAPGTAAKTVCAANSLAIADAAGSTPHTLEVHMIDRDPR